jgi:hypothetical protein
MVSTYCIYHRITDVIKLCTIGTYILKKLLDLKNQKLRSLILSFCDK